MKFIKKPRIILLYLALALSALLLAIFTQNLFSTPVKPDLCAAPKEKTVFTTSTGEKYQWSSVKIGGGGFVTGVVVHPNSPDIIYVRTDAGGLFRWNVDRRNWTQLIRSDRLPNNISYSIESVAIAPGDPNILYIATGAYTKKDQKLTPGNLLKSTDRGNSWQVLNLSLPIGGNEFWRWTGERLAIDPNNSNVVYFGSRLNGLWKTEDGGKSWNQVNSSLVPIGDPHPETDQLAGVSYVVFDSTSGTINGKTKIIYAGVSGQGIYRSNDAGTNWKLLAKEPIKDLVPQQGVVNNQGELITTFYGIKNKLDGGVWKFTASGWQDITPKKGRNYSAVTVDPNKPNTIFVVTYPMTPEDIYRSDDGGKTWVVLKNTLDKISWWPNWSFYTLTGGIAVSRFHPGQVWLTNGIGVWQTENGYQQNVKWLATIDGIEETVTFDAISTPKGASLITAIADFDGFRHECLNAIPIKTHGNGVFNTTTSLAYSSNNPNFIVSVGASHHGAEKIRAGFSVDNGKNWQNFPSIEQKTHPEELVFGNVAVSATNTKNIVWQPTDWKLPYFTKDGGSSWKRIDFFGDAKIGGGAHTHLWNPQKALAADSVKDGIFYIYHHRGGQLIRTDDGGENWQIVNEKLPAGVWKGANLRSAPGMQGEIWLSLREQGLYRSSNFGKDFTKIESVEEADVLGFGKAAPNVSNPTVFVQGKVKGEVGVFRSTDLGASWVIIVDYPDGNFSGSVTLVGDLNVFGRVFIGTGGNGFLYGELIKE